MSDYWMAQSFYIDKIYITIYNIIYIRGRRGKFKEIEKNQKSFEKRLQIPKKYGKLSNC